MLRNFILIFFFSVSFYGFGQDTIQKRVMKKYITLQVYKEAFGKPTDTTEIIYKNNDTLVNVPLNFEPYDSENMVRVKYEPKDSTFLNIYKDVVYKTDKKVDTTARMRYWKDEVKIFFDNSVPVSHAKELMSFAEEISENIDSLKISHSLDRDNSNLLIYYLNREDNTDYDPRIVGKTGGYYINWNGKQQIYKGSIKVNTENATSNLLQKNLLKYWLFKSLGNFKSSRELNPKSFLSYSRKFRSLQPMDLELLKYHYSYGVCKGVDLKSFNDLISSMQETLKKDPNAKLYVLHDE